jgi:hypothetical protein
VPLLVEIVHWWPTPIGVRSVLVAIDVILRSLECDIVGDLDKVAIQDPSPLVLLKSKALPRPTNFVSKLKLQGNLASEGGYKWLDIMTHH